MADSGKGERKGRRLLVAALGVATVSYASQSGCEPEPTTTFTSGNLISPPADAAPPSSGDLPPAPPVDAALPTSGNLLPPPPVDAALPTSGNLLPPPPVDAALPTSGNLLPPPPVDAGRAKDAAVKDANAVDSALPTSGNLLPPPPPETK